MGAAWALLLREVPSSAQPQRGAAHHGTCAASSETAQGLWQQDSPQGGLQAATSINLADARDELCLHLWSGTEGELSVPLELPRRPDTALAIKHRAWSVIEENIRNRGKNKLGDAETLGKHLGGVKPGTALR